MDRIITIGRQFGAGGREIGKAVAARLNIPYYDKELLVVAAKESGLDTRFLENYDERTNSLLYSLVMGQAGRFYGGHQYDTVETLAARAQREALLSVARNGPCVIVGRCADEILRQAGIDSLNVFVYADQLHRAVYASELTGITNATELQKLLKRVDSGRQVYYNHYTGKKWGDPHNYHMSLDSGTLGYDLCAKFIVEAIQAAD